MGIPQPETLMPTTTKKKPKGRARTKAAKSIEQLVEDYRALELPDRLADGDVRRLVSISATLKQRIESGQESRVKEREATKVRKEIHELLGVDPAVVRRRR
jgi:hypothetical protein